MRTEIKDRKGLVGGCVLLFCGLGLMIFGVVGAVVGLLIGLIVGLFVNAVAPKQYDIIGICQDCSFTFYTKTGKKYK